jgi:serine/threonine protein kinase
MTVFAGSLQKQHSFLKTWKRHYYQIQKDFLVEFDAESGPEQSRLRITASTQIEPLAKRNKPWTFKISLTMSCRPLLYAADSEALMNQWIAKLTEAKTASGPKAASAASFKLTLSDFDIVSVLGRGTFGKVSLVRHKESQQLFAMKAMSKSLLVDDGNVQQILRERDILLRNHHPFLVAAHFTFQTDTKIFLILDYVPGGDLYQRLKSERGIQEERARLIAAELVLGLGHLHRNGFVYRDLKPENILFDENGHVRLTDFGYAKQLQGADKTSTFCGTADYLAPEVLLAKPYNKSVDWWSFGCVIFEILTGVSPFYCANLKQMYRSILQDDPKFPQIVSPNARDLLTRLLRKNPTERLGNGPDDAKDIQAHPFFTGIDWKAVFERKIKPPWKPAIKSETDTSLFDEEFTGEAPIVSFEQPTMIPDMESAFANFTSNADSIL